MVRRSLIYCLMLLCGSAYGQSCTTTLNAGAAVGTSITNAAAGDVICLNNGNYSGFTLNNVSKSPRVTVRAVNSGSANITTAMEINGASRGMTFDGINFTGSPNPAGIFIRDGTYDVTVKNGAIPTGVRLDYMTATTPNILFENIVMHDQDDADYCTGSTVNCLGGPAGFLIYDSPPYRQNLNPVIIIRGADINRGCADGIKLDVPGIVEFSSIQNRDLGVCSGDPHVDGFQNVGGSPGVIFRYNYVYNNQQNVVWYDEATESLVEHNVIDVGVGKRSCGIELYSDDGSIVRNNTLINRSGDGGICLTKKPEQNNGTGTEIYNNIAAYISIDQSTASVNTKNLIPGGGGTNISGSPTFKGTCQGTSANWSGCALANGSSGKNGGTDGKDVGTHYYGIRKPTGLN